MPANGRQHGRCPADSQGKMLAPRNGGIRLCRHRGANSDGERLRSRQNVGASQRRHKALPAMGRQLGRCPADSQGKMLAPRNGGIRLCRQWGANSVGDRPSLRVKCWRPATEIQGFAGNGAPTWAMPGRFSGQNVGAPQRRHKALPAPRRQLGRCPGHLFLFFRPGVGARIPADPCSFVPFAPSLRTFSALGRHGLGAQIPAKPCSFVPFAPNLRAFSALGRRGLGAHIPAKPCSFVPFAPSLRTFSALGRRGLGAQTPARPCSFVHFAPSLRTFSALGRHGLGAQIPAKPVMK